MSLRRGGTPLNALPSLEAANQAQIEDLVQRNRTLEHTIKKLAEQVAQEKSRAAEAVSSIQNQWELNKQKWKEAVDDLVASQRIVEKQVEVELEKERTMVIKEMSVTREEKLQRLHRDFKIKLFQIREEELESKIEELEEEIATLQEEHDLQVSQERQKASDIARSLKEVKVALSRMTKEKEEKESKYNKLLATQSNLEAKNGTLDSKVQRTQLQLEGLHTKITEFESKNDELRRKNVDLTQQLERWKDLETKGGETAEKEHKMRLDLEIELQELREEFENYKGQSEADLAKEKKRTAKAMENQAEWESEAKQQEKDAKEATKQLNKLQKLCDKLKTELEVERARVRPPSPEKRKTATSSSPSDDLSEGEPKRPQTSPNTPVEPTKAGPSTTKKTKQPNFKQVARKSTGGKPPRTINPANADENEVVEIVQVDGDSSRLGKKRKGKEREREEQSPPPHKSGKRKAKTSDDDEEEVQFVEKQKVPKKGSGKRKAKASDDDEEDEGVQLVEKPKATKKGSKAPSEIRELVPSKTKTQTGSRATSKQPTTIPEPVEPPAALQPQKKKRKIVSSIPPTGPFAFQSLNVFDDQINGLNIPSTLSPVRQDEAVPQRSMAASVAGSIGSYIKLPFSRKS